MGFKHFKSMHTLVIVTLQFYLALAQNQQEGQMNTFDGGNEGEQLEEVAVDEQLQPLGGQARVTFDGEGQLEQTEFDKVFNEFGEEDTDQNLGNSFDQGDQAKFDENFNAFEEGDADTFNAGDFPEQVEFDEHLNAFNEDNTEPVDVGNYLKSEFIQQPQEETSEDLEGDLLIGKTTNKVEADDDCWMTMNAADHFKAMNGLDEQYAEVRQNYQLNVGEKVDHQMLEELLGSSGAAPRAIHNFGGDANRIPAGINLGGFCMMRLQDSLLFFHRMKLRNSTLFHVKSLHNDMENMVLMVNLDLNDLHLLGAYERSATHKDPSILYYRPSYGSVEVLLRNVDYKMEARMRMMADRITVELVNSELVINQDILMSYLNTNTTEAPEYTVKVQPRNLEDFLQRLKTDLDLWLKDYFNDFFMYFQLPEYDSSQFQEYEKKKTILLNDYANYAITTIKHKIISLGGHTLSLPKFTLFAVPNMVLKIKDGVLRGLDSMYQRSVATGRKNGNVRNVDVIVGFSRLKAEYTFEALVPNGTPPLTGYMVLSADELTAHMGISLVVDPESVGLNFDFIQQLKPETLSLEGPTSRLIANFKHLLEHQIMALMSNAIMHNVKLLNSITRCRPFIYGHVNSDSGRFGKKTLKNAKKAKRRSIGRNKGKGPGNNKKIFFKTSVKNNTL